MVGLATDSLHVLYRTYVKKIIDTERHKMPGGKIMREKYVWDIIRKSALKCIGKIFRHYEELLKNTSLDYTKPEGTSFRIFLPDSSFGRLAGINSIVVSIDLLKNQDILKRVKNSHFVIEVSIHDSEGYYLSSNQLGYTRKDHVKFFDNLDFDTNIRNSVKEVSRILTFSPNLTETCNGRKVIQ